MVKAASIVLILGAALAAQEMRKVSVQPTSAVSGEAMFREYCAVCHGAAAKGDGPAATLLKKRPADLTQLARKNNGRFPDLHVVNFIIGNEELAAHGTRDMPAWGELFHSLDVNTQSVSWLRVSNLKDYVKSLQAQ